MFAIMALLKYSKRHSAMYLYALANFYIIVICKVLLFLLPPFHFVLAIMLNLEIIDVSLLNKII